jgi:hypothetical protein
MQGLWALHMYLKAATDTTDEQSIGRSLPEKVFQLTHEWFRSYDPKELVRAIRDTGIDFLLSRASLVSLVVISEAAVGGMNARLAKLLHSSEVEGNKRLLQWAFGLLRDSTSGSESMLRRLPETCGDLDNARRLRNCIVHNNGKYSNRYSEDAIDDRWVVVQREPDTSSAAAGRHAIQLKPRDTSISVARTSSFSTYSTTRSKADFSETMMATLMPKRASRLNGIES